MELRHLRYFVAVAQALNFTRAAEKLHTSQPSLSSQIRDLENCVGVPLLVRDKRKVALTAAGECFLQDALAILEQAENAKLRARKIVQEDRQLTIGFVPSAEVNLLPKVLPMFRLRQPDTLIELVSLITTEQEEKIRRGELDVGLMRHPVYSPEIDYLELFDEPLVVVLPVDHPLAHEKEITAAQLDGVNFVSTDQRIPVRLRRSLKRGLRKKQPAKYRPGGNEYSGDHESGGDGAGRHFDTRLYE